MKKILKSTYYTSVTILFLLIAVAGLTQTKTFRSYLRTIAIDELTTIVDGTVEFRTIEGNLVTGLQLNDVIISRKGREILSADRLEARYDLSSMFLDRVSISRLTLVRPRIHLWRGLDGQWNVDGLIIAADEEDTSTSPLTLDFRRIELLSASVDMIDSLALAERIPEEDSDIRPETFDYAQISVNPLSMHAALHVSSEGILVSIRSLEAESVRPDFHLLELSGQALLTPDLTQVKSLSVRTKDSRLSLDARISGIDIAAISNIRQLESAPLDLKLSVDRLSFNEFRKFLPGPVDFLDHSAAFDINATGTLGNLNIREVSVRTPRTYVRIQGTMRNVHRPPLLEMDLAAQDNIIHPEDLPHLLPGLELPDFRSVGILNCNLHFQGSPSRFKAFVGGRISAGEFTADADLDLRKGFAYSGTITTAGLDLGSLLDDDYLSSSLTTTSTIAGSGTSLNTLTAVFRLEADSSAILDRPVSKSVVVVDVADQSLRTNLLLNVGETRIDLNAR
ncbi:MAG TPA: hypothetical protein VGA55_06175, partial [Bacteroidota bacterium]